MRKTVTELLLPGGYDSEGNPNRGGPFAGLTLARDRRCQWLGGAIGNKRINYGCPGGRYLAGNPNRRTRAGEFRKPSTVPASSSRPQGRRADRLALPRRVTRAS